MQAITTKYISPTNHRGARYKATCEAMTLTMGIAHAMNSEENHIRVARALIARMGWFHETDRGDRYGDWYHGGTADGYVFVCAVAYARVDNYPATTRGAIADPDVQEAIDRADAACRACGRLHDGSCSLEDTSDV